MARLEIDYMIKEGNGGRVINSLENKGKGITDYLENAKIGIESYYLGELVQAWEEALESLKSGNPFSLEIGKGSFESLEFSKRGLIMRSSEAESFERRYYTARVPGSSDSVDIRIFGKNLNGYCDYPLTIQMGFDTHGYSDGLYLSKQGIFHQGPEGIRITRKEESERADYRIAMFETTCGALHLWRDVFWDLDKVTDGIVKVSF